MGRIPNNLDYRAGYTWHDQSGTTSGIDDMEVDIVIVQSNPHHYWCTCAHRTLNSYAKKHSYGLTWATPTASSVINSKMMKYSLASLSLNPSRLTVIMDCDVFITNPEIRVQDIWREWAHEGTEVLIARDAHWRLGVPINSGLIIMRGGEFSEELMRYERFKAKANTST